MGSHLEGVGEEVIGYYKFRCVRTDATVKYLRPKFLLTFWPGSCEVMLEEVKMSFLSALTPGQMKELSTPGIKRLFYIHQVKIPGQVPRPVDILFAFQQEESGKVVFASSSGSELNAVIKKAAVRHNAVNYRTGKMFLFLLFPLSLFLYKPLFKNGYYFPKPIPPQTEFQRFVGRAYKKPPEN